MPGRDIIVVGASAGGVEPLVELARGLSADLAAAVFVVLHLPPTARSALPKILGNAGPLPAVHPRDGEPIQAGRIYVAPPNNHLVLSGGRVLLDQGPRINGVRPAADVLFRSASRAYGQRVVGVLLSGTLGDGTEGLRAITMRGGIAVVQDPDEARFAGMPTAALARAEVNFVLPVSQIASLLKRSADEQIEGSMSSDIPGESHEVAAGVNSGKAPNEASGITCPACHGSLWEVPGDPVPGFECRVGHRFSGEAFLGEQGEAIEAAIWSAINSLQERADTLRRVAARLDEDSPLGRKYLERAEEADGQADTIRQALTRVIQADALGGW
jgi:two-component system, chemotaxis family, protein-glutamate methylesterase/glutaminase